MRLLITTVSLALIAGLGAFAPALAQNLERDQLNVSGTLKQAAPGAIQIATAEGDTWMLKVEARPQDVSFSGSAEKSFLRSGMYVEFRAQVSKKRGTVAEPVSALTVFTPSEARPPGIDADVAGGGSGGLFSDAKEEKKPDAKERKAAKLKGDDTVYRIAGAISKVGRAGDITVSAGGTQVKFNLAEDCRISVETNDLSFVSAGDKVTAQGWFYKGRPGQGAASKIEVTAANPLTDSNKKKPAKPVKESKTGAKAAKGEKGDKGDKEEKPAEEDKKDAKGDKKDGDKKGDDKPELKKDG